MYCTIKDISGIEEIINMSKLSKTYLSYTFLIMLVCWGTCVLCSFNDISLSDHKLLLIPYLLGGLSPTIASYLSFKAQ